MDKLSKMDLAIIRCALQTELRFNSGNKLMGDQIEDLYARIMDECAKREAKAVA